MARRSVPIRQSDLVRRFAVRVREVRVARGLTQAGLAAAAQVTAAYVSRLEGGRVAPGIDLVERLAAALGTGVADLLPANSPPDPLPGLRADARRMLEELERVGDATAFTRLTALLAAVLEAARRRR